MTQDVKRDILWRVYLVYFVVFIFGLLIVGKAAHIQWKEKDELLEMARKYELSYFNIEANRGNILAEDGSLLATSIPVFEIRMDVDSENISDKFFYDNVDSLAYCLSRLFGDRSASSYRNKLVSARKSGNRYYLLKRKVTYEQLKQLRSFPVLRLGKHRGGLIVIPRTERELPYKNLAQRTIGYEIEAEDIKVGLEGYYGEWLGGTSGKQLRRRINHGDWMPVFDENMIEPQNGKDIRTTIDVNLQDVAEAALYDHLEEHEAYMGCVVLMEVRTGKIKAIANLRYDSARHRYEESYNMAIGESVEPGSTFKLASMIAALEKGGINLQDSVETGDGWTMIHGYTIQDVHKIRNGWATYREVFEESSNVGTYKMIQEAFGEKPEVFIDMLYDMSLNKKLDIGIRGEGRPYIKHPSEKKTWYGTSLAYISHGYEVQMTPLQLLTLYNAVANDGVMVKPMFVSEISYAGMPLKTFETQVINRSICSKSTLEQVRSLLEGVVERGTATLLKNDFYKIAGKTGTAKIAQGSKGYSVREYNASFVGYFPADNPRYSCIVVVNRPRKGNIYGGTVAAPVFKEIADKIYATQMNMHPSYHAEKKHKNDPGPVFAQADDLRKVMESIGYAFTDHSRGSEWAGLSCDDGHHILTEKKTGHNTVPDVRGMTARDAVYLLESKGYRASLSGRGWVSTQVPVPGAPSNNREVKLKLSVN